MKDKPEDFGKKIATVHICMREKGVVFRFKKPQKTDDRAKLLIMSTVERMEKRMVGGERFQPRRAGEMEEGRQALLLHGQS
jgi:hypothetical protein